jgi:hypothetical protein
VAQWLHSLRPELYSLTFTNKKITNFQIVPSFLQYFEETVQLTKEEDTICPICSENCVTVQTKCRHNYCKDCLHNWLLASSTHTCPYCRDPIYKVYRIV